MGTLSPAIAQGGTDGDNPLRGVPLSPWRASDQFYRTTHTIEKDGA